MTRKARTIFLKKVKKSCFPDIFRGQGAAGLHISQPGRRVRGPGLYRSGGLIGAGCGALPAGRRASRGAVLAFQSAHEILGLFTELAGTARWPFRRKKDLKACFGIGTAPRPPAEPVFAQSFAPAGAAGIPPCGTARRPYLELGRIGLWFSG